MTIPDRSNSPVRSRWDAIVLATSRTLSMSKDYALGLFILGVVVFLWTSSNFFTQAIFEEGYEKPFLVTYLNTSSFVLYLVPYVWKKWKHGLGSRDGQTGGYQPLPNETEPERPEATTTLLERPLTDKETSDLALTFCVFWFIANWAVNASLDYTSVASATILSSTSGLFTMAISRFLRLEIMTRTKVLAVVISFGGILLVSLSDSKSSSTVPGDAPVHQTKALLGDFLALVSAIFYALYVTLLKVKIREESRIDMKLFFGFVGLYNIMYFWILGAILHVLGIETFKMPSGAKVFLGIAANMFVTFSSDYLYVIAMLKTTPLVVTIGLSLTIPLAVLGDLFLGRVASTGVLLGAGLVVTSFIMVGLGENEVRGKTEVVDDPAHASVHEAA